MTEPLPKKSDLPVRVASAVVMVAVAGAALWLGGGWLDAFIVLVALAAFGEFVGLLSKAIESPAFRIIAIAFAAAYVGLAAWLLLKIDVAWLLLLIVGSVVLVDIFAYFFGRTIGGPKIAPSISPSKTWAGLLGGTVGASTAFLLAYFLAGGGLQAGNLLEVLPAGAAIAVLAQSGDFFESWLKRRAGVKDSSNLIPGHGGVLDRVDGLLPVAIVVGSTLVVYFPLWLNR